MTQYKPRHIGYCLEQQSQSKFITDFDKNKCSCNKSPKHEETNRSKVQLALTHLDQTKAGLKFL